MRFIDLKSNPFQHHPCASLRKEMADEFRKDGVLSADGFSTFIRVSPLCRSLPGQLQSEELFMLGSVSVFGLCSAHLSRKFARHRDLSESRRRKTLPHGHSRQGFSQHSGSRQRGTRLENLPGLCPSANPKRQGTSPKRSSRSPTRSKPLMLWILPSSICAYRYSHGRSFENARAQ